VGDRLIKKLFPQVAYAPEFYYRFFKKLHKSGKMFKYKKINKYLEFYKIVQPKILRPDKFKSKLTIKRKIKKKNISFF